MSFDADAGKNYGHRGNDNANHERGYTRTHTHTHHKATSIVWNGMIMEWKDGNGYGMERWNNGMIMEWKDGMIMEWKDGIME